MTVYFIRAGATGPIKIGTATDLTRRVSELQTGHYEMLSIIATIEGGRAVEGRFHRLLAEHRLRGEWFRATDEVLAAADRARAGVLPALPQAVERTMPNLTATGQIIERLGGSATVAADLGMPLTTVRSWADSNFIPVWRQASVVQLALSKAVAISTGDFPPREARISRRRAASEAPAQQDAAA